MEILSCRTLCLRPTGDNVRPDALDQGPSMLDHGRVSATKPILKGQDKRLARAFASSCMELRCVTGSRPSVLTRRCDFVNIGSRDSDKQRALPLSRFPTFRGSGGTRETVAPGVERRDDALTRSRPSPKRKTPVPIRYCASSTSSAFTLPSRTEAWRSISRKKILCSSRPDTKTR